jgi:hypothetical protein
MNELDLVLGSVEGSLLAALYCIDPDIRSKAILSARYYSEDAWLIIKQSLDLNLKYAICVLHNAIINSEAIEDLRDLVDFCKAVRRHGNKLTLDMVKDYNLPKGY